MSLPKALVIQTGARRGYASARMLESAGALAALYTTTATPEGAQPSGAARLLRVALPGRAATFDRRVVRDVDPSKVHTCWSADLARGAAGLVGAAGMRGRQIQNRVLGWRAAGWPAPSADIVLSVDGNGGPALLRRLKRRGLRIAVDVAITPTALEVAAEEARRWPGWGARPADAREQRRFRAWYQALVGIADAFLYPSETVLDGLQTLAGFDPGRAHHVPYALGAIDPLEPQPEAGRVLFAGTAALRKGLPYFALAAARLRQERPGARFLVAGDIPERIKTLPDAAHLEFLGHLSRRQMAEELARAEVFCLPSLAEGTAAVVLEALASGLPCVVTRAAGAPVRHGVDGFVVPERDVDALAGAVGRLLDDGDLRGRLALAARAGAERFSQAAVRARLLQALLTVVDGNGVS